MDLYTNKRTNLIGLYGIGRLVQDRELINKGARG